MIITCTTRCNIQQFHVLLTQVTYVVFTDLRTKSSMVLTESSICAVLGHYAAWNGIFTDVLAQYIGPILKGRTVQERRSLLHNGGILKWKKKLLEFYGP